MPAVPSPLRKSGVGGDMHVRCGFYRTAYVRSAAFTVQRTYVAQLSCAA